MLRTSGPILSIKKTSKMYSIMVGDKRRTMNSERSYSEEIDCKDDPVSITA